MAEETRERRLLSWVMAEIVDTYLRKLGDDTFERRHASHLIVEIVVRNINYLGWLSRC